MAASNKPRLTKLSDDVAKFVSLGIHRAGATGERQTARWLTKRLAALGYRAKIDPFAIKKVLSPGGHIICENAQAALFPKWFRPETALGKSIKAPLVPLEADTTQPAIRILTQPAKNSANWGPALDAIGRASLRLLQDAPR